MNPIIMSTEDNDSYVANMGVIARQFDHVRVRYEYINRDPTFHFADGFEEALHEQLEMMENLRMTQEEFDFQRSSQTWIPQSYSEWKRDTFRYKKNYVNAKVEDGRLKLSIEGPWSECMPFETPLLATISRLRFTIMLNNEAVQPDPEWKDRLRSKFDQMVASHVNIVDYGSRRRFDFAIEDAVCKIGKDYAPYFRGTANPYLAQKHGLKVFGTNAHQYTQFMMAKYGPTLCNRMAMEHWSQTFRGDLGVALTDTVSTPVFLRDFDRYYAKLFDGVRQDSGNPHEIGEMIIKHYESLGIDPTSKVIVFSDSLDAGKACTLTTKFSSRIKVTCGIGTNLTHDVGHPPMNHVIKATAFDFGQGWIPVVKLSDVAGKESGDPEMIELTRKILRVAA